jgi:fructosamine-3-kinase
MNDWVEFNAVNRLGFQLELACNHGRIDPTEATRIEGVIAKLDRHIPRTPRPSLLHGDLWSGNALPTRDRNGDPAVAVIDPACSIGHGLADIAMMQLFGGIGPECYRAYEGATGIRLGDCETRAALAVYQLYHVLNHVNLFGRGYASQAMALVQQLGM